MAVGASSTADRANAVSIAAQGAERQLVKVAASTQGTDAANQNQLNSAVGQVKTSTDQRFNEVGQALGSLDKSTRLRQGSVARDKWRGLDSERGQLCLSRKCADVNLDAMRRPKTALPRHSNKIAHSFTNGEH